MLDIANKYLKNIANDLSFLFSVCSSWGLQRPILPSQWISVKYYFAVVILMVFGAIFFIGAFCGRITRHKYTLLKNKWYISVNYIDTNDDLQRNLL